MRIDLRLALVSCIAVLGTACSGGSRAIPTAQTQSVAQTAPLQTQAQTTQAVAIDGVPQSALTGVEVTVHLPVRNSDQLDALIAAQSDKSSPEYRHFLTPEQFRESYGPSASDVAAVKASLQQLGFTTAVTSQSIIATAPQAKVESAFNIHLSSVQSSARMPLSMRSTASQTHTTVMSADRAPTLPQALVNANATIGFASIPYHVDSHLLQQLGAQSPMNSFSPVGPYYSDDLKQAYSYPSFKVANGAGTTIAIVMSSDVDKSDTYYWFHNQSMPAPTVSVRPVDGGAPAFNINNDSAIEASLDVQQSGGSAPGAHIILYGIPSLDNEATDDAYQAIVDDNKADIVSSSFGECELYFTPAYNNGVDYTYLLKYEHDIFRQGNAQGITFVASSGDYGAYECSDPTGTQAVLGVSNPAEDPDVTAVGGTNLITKYVSGSLDSAYVGEEANYDPLQTTYPKVWGSGGGVSKIFAKPAYQLLANTGYKTRTIPDVSMHMGGCPAGISVLPCNPDDSADLVYAGGYVYGVIGTSASSPDFAGLLAVTEQNLGGRLGNANGYIYTLAALDPNLFYRRNIPGDNGYYKTSNGYNEVLGNGTPIGSAFALDVGGPVAGTPLTPSNP